MNSKSPEQSLLREADNVTGVGGTFQAMKKHNLTTRRSFRLVFESYDRIFCIDFLDRTPPGKALPVYLSRPIVAGNGGQMCMAKERSEFGTQTRL